MIVIDNVASAAPGVDENAKAEWDEINQWLLRLRKKGLTVILIHHAGWTDEHSRGTSAREDNLDVVIRLRQPADYNPADGARFIVNFTKCRVHTEDKSLLDDYEFKLEMTISGYYEWSHSRVSVSKKNTIQNMLRDGLEPSEICKEVGVAKSYVSKIKKQMENQKTNFTECSQNER